MVKMSFSKDLSDLLRGWQYSGYHQVILIKTGTRLNIVRKSQFHVFTLQWVIGFSYKRRLRNIETHS